MSTSLSPDRLAALEEERDFLLRSLSDLDAELEAGDIDEADHKALTDDYTARTAEVLRAIGEHRDAVAAARPARSTGRIVAIVGAVALVAVVAGVLVAQASGRREPGQTATGNAPQTANQALQRCVGLTATGKAGPAVDCYQKVLEDHPGDPGAYTYLGWTLYLASGQLQTSKDQQTAITSARGFLDKAIEANPRYADAYAFRAVIALRVDGDADAAQRYLDRLDGLNPPASVKVIVQSLRDDIAKSRRTTTTTTTTTTSTTPP